MAYNVYPVLRGLKFPIKKTALLGTNIQQTESGAEFRTGYMQYPLYEFELSYDYLSDADRQQLHGFFIQQGGALTPFSFDHLNDDTVSVAIATLPGATDGVTQTFVALHSTGGLATEPVGQINTVTGLFSDGVSQPQTALTAPGVASLSQQAGGALGATTYYVKCTWLNQWGETVGGSEANLAVSANNVLKVTQPASPPATAKYWSVYVSNTAGGGSGAELLQTTATKLPIATTTWTEPTSGLAGATALPGSNTTGWSISTAGNGFTFGAVPETGHNITWTGTFYYLCRFKSDDLEIDQFANLYYEQTKLTLRTVQ